MSDNLKAYMVSESGEGHACVAFAVSGAPARQAGAGELGTDWDGIESCRRAPEFDAYAPGPVPKRALYDAGWWFECGHCGHRVSINEYHEYRSDDEGNDAAPEDFGFFERGRQVYCCRACMAKDEADDRTRAAHDAALVELVALKYPEVLVVSYAYWNIPEPKRSEVRFTLPGLEGMVRWIIGENTVSVERRDVENFKRLYSPGTSATPEIQPARPPSAFIASN
ncbi:hypothetical protein [Ideonella livida]|uniref:Uncharacterized protein n=1 Tax=Ideonella livida TaxID=2707176 RepID=A0A7C9PFG3_9BURK|nr:hypothetical protein [Ideonella livida]NDY89714.1 hypothetical protein [Ideonella livida]